MMVALAQRPGLTRTQLGIRAGLSSKSGTFGTYLGRLRALGHIVDHGQRFSLTPAGKEALGGYRSLPKGQDLANYWIQQVPGGASRMLATLVGVWPKTMTDAQLAESVEMSEKSGTFGTYLRLRALEVIEGTRSALKATNEFFE